MGNIEWMLTEIGIILAIWSANGKEMVKFEYCLCVRWLKNLTFEDNIYIMNSIKILIPYPTKVLITFQCINVSELILLSKMKYFPHVCWENIENERFSL